VNGVAAPFCVIAVVLVGGGIAKVRDATPTAQVLQAARVPGGHGAARWGGAAEAALGAIALWTGAPEAAAAVALVYAAFAAFLVRVVAGNLPVASCGCLGAGDSPPGWTHVGFDAAAAAVAAVAAATGGAALPHLVELPAPEAVVAGLLAAVAVRLVWLLLIDLPRLRPVPLPGLEP
jgi:hypothetical protein